MARSLFLFWLFPSDEDSLIMRAFLLFIDRIAFKILVSRLLFPVRITIAVLLDRPSQTHMNATWKQALATVGCFQLHELMRTVRFVWSLFSYCRDHLKCYRSSYQQLITHAQLQPCCPDFHYDILRIELVINRYVLYNNVVQLAWNTTSNFWRIVFSNFIVPQKKQLRK